MLVSLLDLVLQNQMPRGGLLGGGAPPEANPLAALAGAQQGQQPQRQDSGIPDALSRLVTGAPSDPSLGAGANQEIFQQGLMTAGLGTLASDPSRGTLGRLAEGLAVSQSVTGQMREKLRQEQEDQARALQMAEVFGEGPLSRDQLTQGIRLALVRGEDDTADTLRQIMDDFPEEGEEGPGFELVNLQGIGTFRMDEDGTLRDPFTGEVVDERPTGDEEDPLDGAFTDTVFGGDVTPEIARLAVQQGVPQESLEQAAQQGFRVRFRADGSPVRILGLASAPQEEQAETGGQAAALRRNLTTLETILADEGGPPNRVQMHLPNEMAPDWVQRYNAAAGNIEINAARAMFGARVSDSERDALAEVLTPRFGDDASTVEQKLNNLREMVGDFEKQQGIFDPNRTPGSGEGLREFGVDPDSVQNIGTQLENF